MHSDKLRFENTIIFQLTAQNRPLMHFIMSINAPHILFYLYTFNCYMSQIVQIFDDFSPLLIIAMETYLVFRYCCYNC